jgi:hypothetical protein
MLLLMIALVSCSGTGSAGRGGGGGPDAPGGAAPVAGDTAGLPAAAGLPALGDLPATGSGRRRISATQYNLLAQAPALQSAGGSIWSSGSLTLDSGMADGLAWAVFELPGLPLDGGIYPTLIQVGKDKPGWLTAARPSARAA